MTQPDLLGINRRHLLDATTAHTAAVAAMLTTVALPTHVVEVTGDDATREYPYLVLYPQVGDAEVDSLEFVSSTFTYPWQITAVGRDFTETSAALDRARMVLVDRRPAVPNRGTGPIQQVPGTPPVRQDPTARDPISGRPLFYGVAQFQFLSTPA